MAISNIEHPRAVDMFCGCGGMSLGFEMAGFDVVAAFDKWEPAMTVHRLNMPDTPVMSLDLSDVDKVIETISPYAPDIMFGGAPCQAFSHAGKRRPGDPRASLTVAYAREIAGVRPAYAVMENVPAARNRPEYLASLKVLHDAGYGLTVRIMQASLCGCPTKRKRLFVMAGLGEPEGFLNDRLLEGLADREMTVRDYLGDSLGFTDYYVAPTNYHRRGVFSIDEPAPTIRGTSRPIPPGYKGHPLNSAPLSDVRALTERERALIQTFPPDFRLEGTKTDIAQMVGNAVPPNLARYVATALLGHIRSRHQEQLP